MIVTENRLNVNLAKYDTIDSSLIASKDFVRVFGLPEDYVEAHLYSNDGRLLDSNYAFKGYTIPGQLQGEATTTTEQLSFTPGRYIESLGYVVGTYRVEYNVLRNKVFNTNQPIFFIKQISSDRTELQISSNDISSYDIENGTLNFINEIQSSPYFKDFILNFGDNKLVNAVNIALDKNTDPYSILVKLYQPLPAEFDVKSAFWFVEELSTPIVFEVELFPLLKEDPIPYLRSANFDIDVDSHSIKPSNYYNINGLLSNNSLSAYQKLLNSLNNKGIQINVDYSDYSNFVHFSSAKERLLNFIYKVQSIETYNSDIAAIQALPSYSASFNSSQSIYNLQNNINTIVTNFDGYEHYLYYNSESAAWPKSNATPPYTLFASTSSQVTNWLGTDNYSSYSYGGMLATASSYDQENPDNLAYTIPGFISEDSNNDQYALFLEMIGQHFDNIWLYIKSITDLNDATNDINTGISKDLVYSALRSLGVKLYNSKSNDNIFNYLIGTSSSGSYAPTGSTYETLVTSSAINVAGQDIQKETLKRIYHNLPLLLKSKGTARGIRALITTFGIPSSILDVNEFGGSDKNSATVEYSYDRFSYALYNSGSNVYTDWYPQFDYTSSTYNTYAPDTLEVRFKPTASTYYTTQSIFELVTKGQTTRNAGVLIKPDTTKGFPYSLVTTYLSGSAGYVSSSLSLPLYHTASNGENRWWNIMVARRNHLPLNSTGSDQYYDTFVKNKIDTRIGHQASSSIHITSSSPTYNSAWSSFNQQVFLGGSFKASSSIFSPSYTFIGNLQEFRMWYTPISESTFNFHVLNPESVQDNISGSTFSPLDYRFSLGNDLYTYNHYLTGSVFSVDPNYKTRSTATGVYVHSASFATFPNRNNYVTNTEEYITNSPNSIYSNPVNHKVRIINNTITGSVLSPFMQLEDDSYINLTKDINFVDVSFSPQNEINKDIIAEYGNTIDLDQLIGDPRDKYKHNYKDLVALNKDYFSKYIGKYNLKDYIKLIQYFDNSLFKMIADYVPGRSNIQTGLTIKSPILERPKAKVAHPIMEQNYGYTEQMISGSKITGNSNYTSSYGDGRDFYNGELSGSLMPVYKQFVRKNRNKYLTFTSSLDTNEFEHSDFNTMLNNVSASATSKVFRKINPYQKNVLEDVQIQDGLYVDPGFTRPRFDGSKSTSKLYTYYTEGDKSYGKHAAIDINKTQYAYMLSIYSKPFQLPERSEIQIKYIIDGDENITDLSKFNNNIATTQNVFKSGETMDISMYDYDPTDPNIQYLTNNSNFTIAEGGFTYSPILYNLTGDANLHYKFKTPFLITSSVTVPGQPVITEPNAGNGVDSFTVTGIQSVHYYSQDGISFFVKHYTVVGQDLYVEISRPSLNGGTQVSTITVAFSATDANKFVSFFAGNPYNYGEPYVSRVYTYTTGGTSTSSTSVFITGSIDGDSRWYADDQYTVRFSATQSLYYSHFTFDQTSSYMDICTFPFTVQPGDMVRFYNTTSSTPDKWSRNDEYTVKEVNLLVPTGSGFLTASVTFDRPLNIANVDSNSFPSYISKYIVLKHLPDETNIIANFYLPSLNTQKSDLITVGNSVYVNKSSVVNSVGNQFGLIFPEYISGSIKDQAGNAIKSLKSQNLI